MMGVFHSPVEIPRLNGFRLVNGHGMCHLTAWRILQNRPLVTLSNNYGGSCEIDLEAEATILGFMAMSDIVAAAGRAAANDQDAATFYVYCNKVIWGSFELQTRIEEPRKR